MSRRPRLCRLNQSRTPALQLLELDVRPKYRYPQTTSKVAKIRAPSTNERPSRPAPSPMRQPDSTPTRRPPKPVGQNVLNIPAASGSRSYKPRIRSINDGTDKTHIFFSPLALWLL